MILLSHIIDIDTPTYGNRDRFIIEETSCISVGASANSSKWTFSTNHLGTHIDVPKHFFDEGKTLTDMPLEFWYSDRVQLVNVPCESSRLIQIEDISDEIEMDTEILLIRSGYEKYRKTDKYWDDNPGISTSLGQWLRDNRPNIKILGFDFISLTSWKYRDEGKRAHKLLLNTNSKESPICIIEDMALRNYSTKLNCIVVAPILVKNTNGSPVTVFGF